MDCENYRRTQSPPTIAFVRPTASRSYRHQPIEAVASPVAAILKPAPSRITAEAVDRRTSCCLFVVWHLSLFLHPAVTLRRLGFVTWARTTFVRRMSRQRAKEARAEQKVASIDAASSGKDEISTSQIMLNGDEHRVRRRVCFKSPNTTSTLTNANQGCGSSAAHNTNGGVKCTEWSYDNVAGMKVYQIYEAPAEALKAIYRDVLANEQSTRMLRSNSMVQAIVTMWRNSNDRLIQR